MQLAGNSCLCCKQNILIETEATWCAACLSVFHHECLQTHNNQCPACSRTYDSPEKHFFLSQLCPECMRANTPPQPECPSCRTRTRWDTRADYDNFLAHMKAAARRRFLRGILELCGALLCLLALIGGFVAGTFSPWSIGILLCFMILASDGIYSFMRSRTLARFK